VNVLVRTAVVRVVYGLATMIGAFTLIFFLIRAIPGNPISYMFQTTYLTPQQFQALYDQFGFNRPLYVQYFSTLAGFFTLNLGKSVTGVPVSVLIFSRLPYTIELAAAGYLWSAAIGIPLGLVAGFKVGSIWDKITYPMTIGTYAIPSFVIGIVFVLFLAVDVRWFPTSGANLPRSIVLPSLTLGLGLAGGLARVIRSSVLEVLNMDYVRLAYSKGLSQFRIVTRHVLRNAFVPVLEVSGVRIASLLAGTTVIESIFAWPGLGLETYNAILSRDVPLVEGGVEFYAFMIVLVYLAVDLSYAFLDPKFRSSNKEASAI
jgi:peptide/nickel transport system permease protein